MRALNLYPSIEIDESAGSKYGNYQSKFSIQFENKKFTKGCTKTGVKDKLFTNKYFFNLHSDPSSGEKFKRAIMTSPAFEVGDFERVGI